ncbi:MAG: hypothetical protein R2940_02330 [Syntrophotaleaceae bacterium]
MRETFECEKCGVISEDRSHLCSPREAESLSDYCGSAGDKSKMCDSIQETAEFTCVSCGRTAEGADMVCNSLKLH